MSHIAILTFSFSLEQAIYSEGVATYWCHNQFLFKPKLIPICALYPFSCVPNLMETGLSIQVYESFCKCAKRRKKKLKKLSECLQACISGMAGVIFFKFGMQSPQQAGIPNFFWFGTKGHRATIRMKFIHCSLC